MKCATALCKRAELTGTKEHDRALGKACNIYLLWKATATYKTGVLAESYVLKKGEGYWVYVPADTTWTVDW
ncbi:MAG: hypothetical protein AB1665_02470 [Candidatus Thermoplasmatota archaeon]